MSGFRESAKPAVVADDPHGARAAAFALPERLRDAIDRPGVVPLRHRAVRGAFVVLVAWTVAMGATVALALAAPSLRELAILAFPVFFFVTFVPLWVMHVGRRADRVRFRFTPKALFVVRGKDEERFPWPDVESVRLRGPFVECRVRQGERARVIRRLRPVLHWFRP